LPLVTMSYPGIIRGNSLLFFVKTEEDTIALYNSTVTSNESDEEKKELKTVKMAEFKKRDDDTWELLANRNIKTAMKPNENYDRLMSNQSLTWEELMQGGAIIPKSTPCSILAQELPIYPQGLVDRNGKRMVAVLVFDEETNSVRFQIRYQCPEE